MPSLAFADQFIAEVDRSSLPVDENFNLSLVYQGKALSAQPDFNAISKDFDILDSGLRQSHQTYNSRRISQMRWSFVLQPKREGILNIPEFSYGSETSNAIEVNVTPLSKAEAGNFILETILDNSHAYIDQQLPLTFKLYIKTPVANIGIEPLDIPNANIDNLPSKEYRQNVSGIEYRVAEVTYLISAEEEGILSIPSLRWEVTSRQSNNGYLKRRILRSEAKTIRIKSIPSDYPKGEHWIPAKSFIVQDICHLVSLDWPPTN
jgi:hypothetical protein